MSYKQIKLYVMSGTGNTYRLACWIKEIANRRKVDTEICLIDEDMQRNQPVLMKDRLVGLLFPTHGFMPSWSMIKFLFRLPFGKGIPA